MTVIMTNKYDNLHIKVGLKIMLERQKRRWSQEKLSELAEISKNSLGAIERGTSVPTINTLGKIASALNIEITELINTSKVDL